MPENRRENGAPPRSSAMGGACALRRRRRRRSFAVRREEEELCLRKTFADCVALKRPGRYADNDEMVDRRY